MFLTVVNLHLFILQRKEVHKVKITEKKLIRNMAECTTKDQIKEKILKLNKKLFKLNNKIINGTHQVEERNPITVETEYN